jgi:serine phosphatase RsbU (regulator of sigma subunit)
MKLSTKILLLVLGVALGISALVIWIINVNLTRHERQRADAAISGAIHRYLDRLSELHQQLGRNVRAQLEDPNVRSFFQAADEGDESAIRHLRDDVFGRDLPEEQRQVTPAFHVLVEQTGRTLFNAAPGSPALEEYLNGAKLAWPYEAVIGNQDRVRRYVVTPQGLFLVLGVPLKAQLNEVLPTHAYFIGLRVNDQWLKDRFLTGRDERDGAPLIAWFVVESRVVASAASGEGSVVPAGFNVNVLRRAATQPVLSGDLSSPEPVQFAAAGEDFVGQAFTLGGTGGAAGRLLLASSLDQALAPLRTLRRQIVLVTIIAALAAVLAATAVSRLLSQPVEQMVAATQRIAAGRLDEPVDVHRNDELGVLAGALNDMAQGVKERQRLREEKVKRDHDLDVARRIQMGVLPAKLPEVKGYDLASYSHPAEQTGGDIFDVVALEEELTPAGPAIAILLADATGHGIGPALSVTQVRAMLRIGVRLGGSLRNVLDQMNRQLFADLDAGRFVTALLGRLDPHAHRFDYDSAGQGPLLHYHAKDRQAEWRNSSLLPLGIEEDLMSVELETMHLEEGDVVALLTDGFYEYLDPANVMFNIQRMAAVVDANHERPAKEILNAVLVAVSEFARGSPQLDDMTAIVIKRA